MPLGTPPPRHPSGGPQRQSVSDIAPGGSGWQIVTPAGFTGDGQASNLSIPQLFREALDGALALVHADGGELATFDHARQVLVLRARSTHPRHAASAFGAMGMPSHPSHPFSPPGASSHSAPSPPRARDALSPRPSHPHAEDDEEIADQTTLLLPAAITTRTFRMGEGLIGLAWERGEPVVMRGEEYRELLSRSGSGGPLPTGIDAPWHLAVPILRPGPLTSPCSSNEVIGVLAIFNRDPMWSFSGRDVELLTLHADRIARAMRIAEVVQQNHGLAEMLDILRTASGTLPELPALYPRVRDLIRHLLDAPSLALLLYHPAADDVSFEIAERDGVQVALGRHPASALPPWWQVVRTGAVLSVAAPEERAAHPEYGILGWGSDAPVQSLIAAPLMIGSALLGAIVAGSNRPDAYAPEQKPLIESIARSAAIVIEHARLTREMQRSLDRSREKGRQLAALNNAVLTLNASLDLDATIQALADQASLLTTAQQCAVFLIDEASRSLVLRAMNSPRRGSRPAIEDVRLPLTWRRLEDVLASGQFMLLDHLESDWLDDSDTGRFLAFQHVATSLIIPITHHDPVKDQDRPLGALFVYTPGVRTHFPPEEIGLLQGLASQAAFSISNARLYQELQQAYELQKELDRLKDEFILTVSHEFRTPLTAIDGYVTLISRHGHKLDQAKLNQFAGEIRQATGQLAGMISMLADANRMSSQPIQLTMTSVNVREAAVVSISTQSPEAKARILLEVPEHLWVAADAERLPLVLANLLSNAMKYAPESGVYRITARAESRATLARRGRAHAAVEGAPEAWVVLGVQDSGPGISPEDQSKLFQKFVRLSHSLTTSVRGTGLGLWICRQYVEAMGGDIWVESALGQGAHFQFCLPAVAPSERR